MVFVVDAAGRYTGYTPGPGMRPFVSPAVFMGKLVRDVMPETVARLTMSKIQAAISTQEPQSMTYELLEPDGPRQYECRMTATDGEVLAVVRYATAPVLQSEDEERRRHLAALELNKKAALVGENRYALSPRELMVLALLIEGLPDKQISSLLRCSLVTVNKHVGSILAKMDARSRTQAAVMAIRQHLLTLPDG
jgi:DNA-binding CsgD family transcriptional regulator